MTLYLCRMVVLLIGVFMEDKISRFTLRVPTELIEWLKASAKDQSRSLNGQVVEFMKKMKEEQEKNESNCPAR